MSRQFDGMLENFDNWTDGQLADYYAYLSMNEPDLDCDEFDCEDFDCDDE